MLVRASSPAVPGESLSASRLSTISRRRVHTHARTHVSVHTEALHKKTKKKRSRRKILGDTWRGGAEGVCSNFPSRNPGFWAPTRPSALWCVGAA